MSKSFKFELNKAGVKQLLQSPEMQAILKDEADKKADEAGDGYAAEVHVGKNRAYANIYPDTKQAANDNFENNTLEKVIRA